MAEEKSDKATDAAVFGTVQSHNIVTTMTKVTEAADVKFGACASLLDIRQAEWTRTAAEVANHPKEAASSRAPWSEHPTVRAEMEAILDFSDEADVNQESENLTFGKDMTFLIKNIEADIIKGTAGEMRNGYAGIHLDRNGRG